MSRAISVRLIAVCLTIVIVFDGIRNEAFAKDPVRPHRLSAEERAELLQYASDTWRSFERMTLPSGLTADGLMKDGGGWGTPTMQTSPTNIGAYIWSTLAAERLKLIGEEESRSRIEKTLKTLGQMQRYHGFYANDIDPRDGGTVKISPFDSTPRRPLVSSVDNAWLAAALTMVYNVVPSLREDAAKLLEEMNFRFFYDPYDAKDPINRPGLLRVGYWADEKTFYGHYGMLNSEARIATYLGITNKQLPPEQYYRLYRTLPEGMEQDQKPIGQVKEYMGIPVFEGAYTYRGSRIVPSWGGSMFEALMVTLFVPEDVWAPRSWGINHPLYVQAQIDHGLEDARYGFWGFSPAASPRGGYETYGVSALGVNPMGYLSYEIAAPAQPPFPNHGAKFSHGVVTPHASFLALRFAPRESMDNLRKLTMRFPIYSQFGFLDSVDVSAGIVSGCVLALDQGMIMAAIANELADDAMQHAFSDGPIDEVIRPIIAMEEFNAGRNQQVQRPATRLTLRR